MKTIFFMSLMGIMMLSSCREDIIYGHGNEVTETRSVGSFRKLEVAGDFNVFITKGDSIQVKVKTPANIIPLLKTKVVDHSLEIYYDNDRNVVRANSIIYITMPSIEGLVFYGNAKISTDGNFSGNTIKLAGTGDGRIEINQGTYENLICTSYGNGLIKAFEVSTKKAKVLVHGNSKIEVKVEDKLEVTMHGNGKVYYKGNPLLDLEIYGNGQVIKK